MLFFYHFLWLYYTIYFSIVKQFFILILYFYYHQFFRYFQRINNAISYNISGKFIIGLCKRKETAALKIKAAVSNGRVKLSALRRLFFFCRRAADHFNIRLKYRYSVLSSTNTTSGRLLNRNGIILFPRPRLTTIFVFPSV